MNAVLQPRVRTVLRQRVAHDVVGLPVVWGVFVLFTALLVGAVAVIRGTGIETSGWEQAAQLTRWYAGAVGVGLTAVHLPLYITHGFTRREFALQMPAFLAVFVAGFALLMTLGYALERAVYGLLGWTQALTGTHLFDAPTQYPLVFVEFVVIGAAWAVAGALLGAAFYRNPALGLGLLPVGLIMVGLAEAAAGPRMLGPIPLGDAAALPVVGTVFEGVGPGTAAAVAAAVAVAGLVLVWALVRDLPVRARST